MAYTRTATVAENAEVYKKVIIEAGKSVTLDSAIDFSAASTVAITVSCVTCTTQATSLNAAGLALQARWTVPNADLYVPTESRAGSAFAFWDSGSVVFIVYGTQFRLVLQNKGTQGVLIDQVTIFRRK